MVDVIGTSANGSNSGPATVSVPSGNVGDLLLAIVGVRNGAGDPTITPAADFDLLGSTFDPGFVFTGAAYTKEADGGEGSTLDFSTSTGYVTCILYRLRNWDLTGADVDWSLIFNEDDIDSPAVTAPANDSLSISAIFVDNEDDFIPRVDEPAGTTLSANHNPAGSFLLGAVSGYLTEATAGAVGPYTWSDSDADPSGTYGLATISIAPSAAASVGHRLLLLGVGN